MPNQLEGEVIVGPFEDRPGFPGWLQSTIFYRPAVSPPPPPGAAGPVAYWKLDGDLADASGNGRDLSGSPSYVGAKYGQGITGAVSRNPQGCVAGNISAVTMTVSMWAKKPNFGSGGSLYLAQDDNRTLPYISLFLGSNAANVTATDGGTPITLSGGTPVSGWNHLALVVTNGVAELYLNGVSVATGNFSVVTGAVGPSLTIQAPGVFGAAADDAAVWSRALTAGEVAAIAAAAGDLSTLL